MLYEGFVQTALMMTFDTRLKSKQVTLVPSRLSFVLHGLDGPVRRTDFYYALNSLPNMVARDRK